MPEYYIQPVTNRQECYTCHKVVIGKIKLSKCKRCHAISRECQVKDWDRHKWNCVPVMVTEFEGKGRGLVAAKDIKRVELIFIDKPLIEVNGTKLQANKDSEGKLLHLEKKVRRNLIYRKISNITTDGNCLICACENIFKPKIKSCQRRKECLCVGEPDDTQPLLCL